MRLLQKLDLREGERVRIRIVRRELAEKVFGSLRIDLGELRRLIEEAEDGLGIYCQQRYPALLRGGYKG